MAEASTSIKDNKTFFYYFCWIFILIILTIIILIVVFSRDSCPSVAITDESWTSSDSSLRELQFLPKSQQLTQIWTDIDSILPPEKIIKGGIESYKNIRLQFQNIPYSKTTPEIQQHYTSLQKGIVIVARDFNSFSSAYVLIRELRHVGCVLPIQLWYKTDELSSMHIEYLQSLGTLCFNIDKYITFDLKHKYSLKILALFFSCFQHVLYLDANNNVLQDPTFLFTSDEYTLHETLFWPNLWKLNASAPAYLNFPTGKTPTIPNFQQDSGQLLFNRERYSKQLWCIFRILEHDLENLFPTPFNDSDKDLFHITWSATGQSFSFIPYRVSAIATVYTNKSKQQIQCIALGQYDPAGKLLFVHQNNAEWSQKPYTNQESWWILIKSHTHPTIGTIDSGTWNPTGPTKIEEFRLVIGTMEDQYNTFLNELRNQEWYQDFYSKELPASIT